MLKILSTLLFIPTLVFATESDLVESDSPWNFDIQYDYISLGDSYIGGSKKITTINLLLDSRLDENTTIHGDFYKKTTKSDYSALPPNSSVSEKGIRELYIESKVMPNTAIMVGKKSFKIDNKKGIQDLGAAPLNLNYSLLLTSECVAKQSTKFNKCLGVKSAYIKSELSDDIQIEFLKTENKEVFLPSVKEYKARLKYSPNMLDYYLTIDKSVENASIIFFLQGFNNITPSNNKTSVELSLIEKKETDSLNQWFVKAKHTNNNCPPPANLSLQSAAEAFGNTVNFVSSTSTTCNLYPGAAVVFSSNHFIHSNSLALGKVFAIDKLLINAELNHNISTYSQTSIIDFGGICTMDFPSTYCSPVITLTTKKERKTNSLSLMLEYPIENGKITSSHLFVRSPYEIFGYIPNYDNANVNLIDITYNFTNSISGKLGYERFDFIPSPYSTNSYDSITYSMKYKF